MRKYIVLCCCVLLILSLFFPTSTDNYIPEIHRSNEFGMIPTTLVDGIQRDDLHGKWTSYIDVTRYIKNDFQVLGSFRVWVAFIYDNEGYVSAYSYRTGDSSTAYGWTLYEKGVTCDGNSITFHMELRKFFFRIPCSITFACDQSGNTIYS